MSRSIISPMFISICMLVAKANAFTINADVDINISSKYVECQPLANNIIELVHIYLTANDDAAKLQFAKEVEKKKKKLKKCQKRGKTQRMLHLNRRKVGIEFRF